MSDQLPPLSGEFDDVCPMGEALQPAAPTEPHREDELEPIAVLGYN